MSQSEKLRAAIEKTLAVNETRPDRVSHLEIVDDAKCPECAGRECIEVCPAATYSWSDENSRVVIGFENCLECGGCRVACPHANISWRYPMGGMGVCYRYG